MVNPLLGDERLSVLQAALSGLAQRQTAIAGNIANVDTPGYRRQDVDFESGLRAQLSTGAGPRLTTTDPHHLPLGGGSGGLLSAAQRGDGPDRAGRNDDNNVDIDYEMTKLSETSLRYELLTQATASRFAVLRDITTHLT